MRNISPLAEEIPDDADRIFWRKFTIILGKFVYSFLNIYY